MSRCGVYSLKGGGGLDGKKTKTQFLLYVYYSYILTTLVWLSSHNSFLFSSVYNCSQFCVLLGCNNVIVEHRVLKIMLTRPFCLFLGILLEQVGFVHLVAEEG